MRSILFATLLAVLGVPALAANAPPTTTFPAPWQQNGTTVSLSVSNSSSNVALNGTGSLVLVCNAGANDAFVALGGSSVVAATSGIRVPANQGCVPLPYGGTYIAGITASATTTLYISVGTGTPFASVPGGGGGGAGITQLTGDVTAGPGSGSQAATVDSIGGQAVTLAAGFTTTGSAPTTLAFPGTGTPIYTFPSASASLATLGANVFTGAQSISAALTVGATAGQVNAASAAIEIIGFPTIGGAL